MLAVITIYVLSDDPHRYDSFSTQVGPSIATASPAASEPAKTSLILDPHFAVLPMPNGVASSFGFRF